LSNDLHGTDEGAEMRETSPVPLLLLEAEISSIDLAVFWPLPEVDSLLLILVFFEEGPFLLYSLDCFTSLLTVVVSSSLESLSGCDFFCSGGG
jgi:hypothetical protein